MVKYLLLLLFSLVIGALQAQLDIQIHPTAEMHVFSNEKMAVFGDMNHQGNSSITTNGEILFYGINWINTPTSTIIDNGTVQFIQPNPLTVTSNQQELDGGDNLASFPQIAINNTNNLLLIGNNTKIRNALTFTRGHIILDTFNLTIGDGNPGFINNYNQNQFVVTNADSTADKGFLIRENFVGTAIEFPIGISTGDYTPARLTNVGIADDYAIRVFNNVYARGTTGNYKNTESVGRTWQIKETTIGGSDVALDLQHNINTEGAIFDPNSNYVARYIGTFTNNIVSPTNSRWDYIGDVNCQTNITPADITTGANIATAARNIRTGFDDFFNYQYYTATVCEVNALPIGLAYLNTELDEDCNAYIRWQTETEINASHFDIEYSTNGTESYPIAKVKATNIATGSTYGYQFSQLEINNSDNHYFRLKMVDFDGSFQYSKWQVLNSSKCLKNQDYTIYPNPNQTDRLFIKIPLGFEEEQNGRFIITDVLGRTVFNHLQTIAAYQRLMEVDITPLASGTYFIHYQNEKEPILSPKKFIVINH